ncbi:ABC transporter substrate-binding protein [Massilia horti]|uniref:ABC transporter substrate-binding protein n=1 Tax=Massilia horti TaxID=2562153 RepID=A0A4Y9T3G5_9BURK|nr:ABC transporter substrate-binding protein [Massilia horti]TFW33816.1 ABC transporter substrate-binding protein [Massilia horti]
MQLKSIVSYTLGAVLLSAAVTSHAEVSEVKIAEQYGIGYLPLMIMEDQKLVEKYAKEEGLGDLKVTWSKFAGGNVMNDALLSDSLQFASGGVAPMVTLWAKTRGNYDVKAVGALNSMPLLLNTRNPKVKTIKDFTDKDKIALPAVKVSIQAVTLQMAAEKAFGAGQQDKLDHLTVSMSHPDGMEALLSGTSEVTAHFSAPPFQYLELKQPGIHTVLNSYDVLGGPATFNLVWATSKFRNDNPKVYLAFTRALDEAMTMINRDKKWAAQAYLRISKDKESVDDIVKMLSDPQVKFTTTPQNVTKYVDFMQRTGAIKAKPSSWKDMFFPNVHNLPGS